MTEGERLTELAKRRGFFLQTAGVYGGVGGFYTYGPHGAGLKASVEEAWRELFVTREGHMEINAPTVMPEPVFEASGHLDDFDDMILECSECGASHRADHLVEDNTDIEDAETLAPETVAELIADNDISCPSCGASLAGEPVENFNLMFKTNIGPGTASPGYLRPETAQGIFVEFPQLAEYARNQLPFGVAQIGRAYRNEISPRKALVRVREFTQAELEHFIDPEEDSPPLERVEDVTLPLYSVEKQQAEDGDVQELTVGEAVSEGVLADEWIAFYLGLSAAWYDQVGIDMERFRYRQHLPGELAHYAADCWDAEAEVDGDWVEITGFAYRGSYDLTKHTEHSGEEFSIFKQYDEPITVEKPTVEPDMSELGPAFGGAAGEIAAELERLAETNPAAFDGDEVTVELGEDSYTVPVAQTGFAIEELTEAGEHVTPHVVEPSFGIDRIVYAALVHALREDEVDGEKRTYLALPPAVAPTTVAVFPLMDRDGLADRAQELATELRSAGFDVAYDDSGAIGRRYRRQDEIGTPFCVTVDYESLEDETVTVRDRDSTDQTRVSVDSLADVLSQLRAGELTVAEL